MVRAFIAVGSNINPEKNVKEALRRLTIRERIKGVSTVYLNEALNRPEQPPYYNCVVEIQTQSSPGELRNALRDIEANLGRVRTEDKYAARSIDLDLILYGDVTIESQDLRLPDPEIFKRPFLAIPLQELAPDLTLSGSGMNISQIVSTLPVRRMKSLEKYTQLLRESFVP